MVLAVEARSMRRRKWLGYVQWEDGIKRAGWADTLDDAMELARNLADRLAINGYVSIGATNRKLVIDPDKRQRVGLVLSGIVRNMEKTRHVDLQLARIRARFARRARAKKED